MAEARCAPCCDGRWAGVATRLDKTEDALQFAAGDVVFSRVTDEMQ